MKYFLLVFFYFILVVIVVWGRQSQPIDLINFNKSRIGKTCENGQSLLHLNRIGCNGSDRR